MEQVRLIIHQLCYSVGCQSIAHLYNFFNMIFCHFHTSANVVMLFLTVLHQNQLTHTDLKPENMLFVNDEYETIKNNKVSQNIAFL
jgi:serine/threonine protein kinase